MKQMQWTKFYIMTVLSMSIMILCACGGNYLPEKYLYKARQKARQLNVPTASSDEITEVVNAYQVVTTKWPLSRMAVDAHYEIAKLYVGQKKYIKARKELEDIAVNFSNKPELAADALFTIGQLHEEVGESTKAIRTYEQLYDLYSYTRKGLYAPLYIAEYYKQKNQHEKAAEAYTEAIEHYTSKIEELGEIKLSAVLQNYIALTYASKGDWEQAAENWELLINKYSQSTLVPATLITLGEVYFVKFKERSKAIAKYTALVEQYPRTKFAIRGIIKLIQINFITADYKMTRKWCEVLHSKASKDRELQAQAKTIIARCLEKENKWEDAAVVYNEVLSDYSDTVASLRIPIFLALHFQNEEKGEAAEKVYEEALAEYQEIIRDKKASDARKRSAYSLSNLIYAKKENWEEVITNIESIMSNPDINEMRKAQALFSMGYLYHHKINNTPKAKEIYSRFLKEYPENQFTEAVKLQLKSLN